MTTKIVLIGKEEAFHAAVRRFPQAELAIRRLMSRNEDFCDMCDELSIAHQALAQVAQLPEPLREERRREWQELIDRLVIEIGETLRDCEGWSPA